MHARLRPCAPAAGMGITTALQDALHEARSRSHMCGVDGSAARGAMHPPFAVDVGPDKEKYTQDIRTTTASTSSRVGDPTWHFLRVELRAAREMRGRGVCGHL